MSDRTTTDPRIELERRIDAIEAGYEFLLAYAAQGRRTDRGAARGQNVRDHLERMEQALDGLGTVVLACADGADPALRGSCEAFFAAVEADARTAQGAIRLVLAQGDIGSQLVDNLNASIHLRALLTDLFVVDEALGAKRKA
ncbi:MAG TPA: hypothetical protein VF322_05745 [Gammaproteobacteria bacterium]